MKKVYQSFNQLCGRAHCALINSRGDFYIGDGVKVIIAVVLGGLLLVALKGLFSDTILPRISKEITDLF